MKEYPCPISLTHQCKYGGNKRYNFGFMSGTASYCYRDNKWVSDLKKCPIGKDKEPNAPPTIIKDKCWDKEEIEHLDGGK